MNKTKSKNPQAALMRRVRLLIFAAVALILPIYVGTLFFGQGGGIDRLEKLPQALEWIKEPLVWKVPEGGVKESQFFHGPPSEGYKFVLVQFHMEARMKIAYPVVPRCFRMVDDQDTRYYPLSRSPLFIERTDRFFLAQGDTVDGELLFEIPQERRAVQLLFDRFTE
ncbi:MAG: hypothetical protein GKR89_23015 [Candidatus Latescibacteria bacterium]|nr:hypothetical protein [Candidatus Latescibacterota bacterium]